MQVRLITTAAVAVSLASALSASIAQAYDYTAPVPFHTTVNFDPANGIIPFPNDLLLLGTTDLTLNIPIDPTAADAGTKGALNALDGFSTSAPWSLGFSQPIDQSSLYGGVHVFEVTLSGPGGGVTGVVRELDKVREYVVALAPSDATLRTVAIVPTAPLKERTSYMAVITSGVKTAAGDSVRGSLPFRLAERTTPLCTGGQSNVSALPAAQACALEPLRQLISSQVAAASGAGVDAGSIVMTWVATTQSITPTFKALESVIAASPPAATQISLTGKNLSDLGLGLPPVAEIYVGSIDLPYYLSAPTADNPTAALTGSWHGAPGAYIPQCAPFGLDPTSTNLTACNPFPVATSTQKVPMLITIPTPASGHNFPETGWPVVIFQHGITRNRTDMFAIAGTLAAQGYAVIAIDLPLHGITDPGNPFYSENVPFNSLGAHERTFDLDFTDNTTGAAGPDGVIDTSGSYFINLTSLLTSRDNLRQGVADLLELSHAIPSMDYHFPQGTGLASFDSSKIRFVGQSLGSIVGTTFLASDPNVQSGVLNVPGGGIARLLDASPAFGPRIHAGLAAAGIVQGTPAYDAYFVATQTVIDSGDPINMIVNNTFLTPKQTADDPFPKSILLQEVIGGGDVLPDQVIPNRVAGAPLSGTEPLIQALGLAPISETVLLTNGGLHGAVRFLQGEHGSLLDPTDFPAATVEMQGEMASFVVSNGNAVIVSNPSVVQGPQP